MASLKKGVNLNKKIKTKFGNAVLNKEYYMITTKSEGHYGKAKKKYYPRG